MIGQLSTRVLLFLLLVIPSATSLASDGAPANSNLTMHGELYGNSCSAKEKKKLISDIKTNVRRNARALQNVVELILCATGTDNNNREISDFIGEVVIISYEGTAEEKVVKDSRKKMEVLNDMMAKGRAWNATLNFDGDEVKLQYFSSAACVESVKLRRFKSSWVVQEIGGACD